MSGLLSNAKLIVVKVGSSLLVDGATGALRRDWLVSLCTDVTWLRGQGVPPGSGNGMSLQPTAEFSLPAGTKPLTAPKRWSPGAYQR